MNKKLLIITLISFMLIMCSCGNSNTDNPVSHNENKHIDEITIVSHTIEPSLSDDFYVVNYKIENNTNKTITFHYISMIEIDINGDILNTYSSCNKHAENTTLEPKQSMYLDLTFAKSDGICQIKNDKYEIEYSNGNIVKGVISEPYVVEISYSSKQSNNTKTPEFKKNAKVDTSSATTQKKYSSLSDFLENSETKNKLILDNYSSLYNTTCYANGNTLVHEHKYNNYIEKDLLKEIKRINDNYYKENAQSFNEYANAYELLIDGDIKTKHLYLNSDGSFISEYVFG